jgi:hypothetical protein
LTALKAQASVQPGISTNRRPSSAQNRPTQHPPTASPSFLNERQQYRSLDLMQISERAKLSGSDPKAIALAIFGTQEKDEGNYQETIGVDQHDPNRPVVILTKMNLSDDSVRGIRYRLEFQPNLTSEARWQVVWAGQQQVCWQDRGSQTWTTESCL